MTVIHKATAEPAGSDPLLFVMSDATVDRMGDVIEPSAWQLGNFKKNPIALFGHKSDFVVGHWKDVRVEGGKLLGRLELLAAGISERLDEIRAAVEAGVLRAVSVGFRALDGEPIGKTGFRYTEAELVECSLVSIPANPNALQVVKDLHLSDDATQLIFGGTAGQIEGEGHRKSLGETALHSPDRRTRKMPNLSERIETAQTELTTLRDTLTEHLKGDDTDATVITELSDQIEAKEAAIASLKRAETALATKSAAAATTTVEKTGGDQRRPFAAPAKKTQPQDLIIRAAVVQVLSHIEKRSLTDVLASRYGEDDTIKTMLDVTTKSATVPATTTATGWAAELVQTATLDFIDTLVAKSIYPVLRDLGGRFTFGRNGVISIPARSATPSIAGSFVGQGAPIPVRQGAFSASTPGTVALVDAADFFTATGDEPRFDVSDQATLHMEDTAPQAIGTVGTPNVVAAPVRSLFQTDSLGLRMILDLNWTMRRAGMVAFVAGVTW